MGAARVARAPMSRATACASRCKRPGATYATVAIAIKAKAANATTTAAQKLTCGVGVVAVVETG
eukprot:940422-Pleurochrysis_carterae.AAC.1